jgi:hypothetical protein
MGVESSGDVSRERHSPEWRRANRQSGDWRSQPLTGTVRSKYQLLSFGGPIAQEFADV